MHQKVSVRAAILTALVCIAVLATPPARADPGTPEQWRAAAQQDLDAVKANITDNTPIGAGVAGAGYEAWLGLGYAQAQARLPQVRDRLSYFYALAAYVNGFHDPHLSLTLNQSLPAPRWPGFVATRQHDGIVVAWRDSADANAPPLGAHIVACDGAGLDVLAERAVFDFVVNPTLPEGNRRAAPRLFIDTGNPFAPPPRACVFETGASQRTIQLNWRALPNPPTAFNAAFSEAGLGPGATFGLGTPAPGVAWIGVPSFAPDAQVSPLIGGVLNQLEIHGDEIRAGRAIVIDLRGNVGGSSEWAQRLARVVFTPDVVAHVPPANPGGAALWRVSQSNLDYWRAFNTEVERQRTSSLRRGAWSSDIVDGLFRALSRHEALWRQGSRNDAPGGGITQRRPRGAGPFPARVYLLSNGSCVSSCLDFADVALSIPGVQLIGAPTSADSLLSDVRAVPLPSGQARFIFAQKIMVGRGRGAMEFYTPDVSYDGPWTDAAVRAWVMHLISPSP